MKISSRKARDHVRLDAKERERLIAEAMAAREFAVAPYSRFTVGAALLSRTGEVVCGANVESVSFGLTCCAERVALFKALTDGHREFKALAVAARHDGGVMPCGACRQLLAEYAPDARVLIVDAAKPTEVREYRVNALLPGAFQAFTPAARGRRPRG